MSAFDLEELDQIESSREKALQYDEVVRVAGMYHGIPPGVFSTEFVTASSALRKFVDNFEESRKQVLAERGTPEIEPEADPAWEQHTQWYTARPWAKDPARPWEKLYGWVTVWKNRETGKFKKTFEYFTPESRKVQILVDSYQTVTAFNFFDAELQAREYLQTLISPNQWRHYVLANMFQEIGPSGTVYYLRQNRPTIVLKPINEEEVIPIGTLCLHALGFYPGTWIGLMPPTDDVIAHLLLIRSDEQKYWRKAQFHKLDEPEAGIC